MGVINITPNSFSDGGLYQSEDQLLKRLNELRGDCDIYDIGAESTAPFNQAINKDEEWERISKVLHILKDSKVDRFSLDTYNVETIAKFNEMTNFKELIWNDVSGCFDDDTKYFLKENPHITYVYCHNLAPKKSETSNHIKYTKEDLRTDDIINYFKEFLELSSDLQNNIWLDPCFGFSKTKEQNLKILKDFSLMANSFANPFVLGISRKSFLRNSLADKSSVMGVENLQTLLVQNVLKDLSNPNLYIRLHDQSIFNAWKFYFTKLSD